MGGRRCNGVRRSCPVYSSVPEDSKAEGCRGVLHVRLLGTVDCQYPQDLILVRMPTKLRGRVKV